MAVLSQTARIKTTDPVTIFTATADCTVSFEITNISQFETSIWLQYTDTPADSETGHIMEQSTVLMPGGISLRNGMPFRSGWSLVCSATNEPRTINLSALISGFTVEV